MIDIVERLIFDATRCEIQFSKGIATNIDEGIAEIGRLRKALEVATDALELWGSTGHVPTDLNSLVVEFRAMLGRTKPRSEASDEAVRKRVSAQTLLRKEADPMIASAKEDDVDRKPAPDEAMGMSWWNHDLS